MLLETMAKRPTNSSSSTYSKSVVFPSIRNDGTEKNSAQPRPSYKDSMDDQIGERRGLRAKSPEDGRGRSNDFNKYVLEKLEFTGRALEEERRGRSLLEDHLRAVMANVRRLSKDMALLQQQVKSEEDNTHSQSIAMKNLEMHQVAGVGDIWNRLTLGDLNTIKLSGDLNKVASEVSDLKRSDEEVHKRLNKLQNAVDSLATKLEKISVEFEKNMQILKVKSESQIQSTEDKIMNIHSKYAESNVNLDQKVEQYCSEIVGNVEHRLDTSLEKQKTWQDNFEDKVANLEQKLAEVLQAKSRKDEDLVRKMTELSVNQHTALKRSHEKLKDGYREAFRAVYESITTMQTVLEAKLKMTESDFKTSINSIVARLTI